MKFVPTAFGLAAALLFSTQGLSRDWFTLGKVSYVEANKDYVQIVVDGKSFIYAPGSPGYSVETKNVIYTAALTSYVAGKPVSILHDNKTFSNNGMWIVMELLALRN